MATVSGGTRSVAWRSPKESLTREPLTDCTLGAWVATVVDSASSGISTTSGNHS